MTKPFSRRFGFALAAITTIIVSGTSLYGQSQSSIVLKDAFWHGESLFPRRDAILSETKNPLERPQNQPPNPARSRADEILELWNAIGNKLIAMAQDFPEDKYDFRVQQEERTFAQNLLHVAAVDYDLMRSVSGSNIGPDFGKNKHNPSQDVYKTKADVVKLLQQAVADGAKLIQQQGEAGLDKTSKFAWGNKLVHNSYTWMWAIEHSAEHYGQLVVYYRANNLVPPDSRR